MGETVTTPDLCSQTRPWKQTTTASPTRTRSAGSASRFAARARCLTWLGWSTSGQRGSLIDAVRFPAADDPEFHRFDAKSYRCRESLPGFQPRTISTEWNKTEENHRLSLHSLVKKKRAKKSRVFKVFSLSLVHFCWNWNPYRLPGASKHSKYFDRRD